MDPYLYLLPSRGEIGDRDSGDSSHLDVVDETHEFVQEPEGEDGVLEAVEGQSPPSESVPFLQLRYLAVVHVLLLLPQEQIAHRVERVGAQLLISKQHLSHM